MSIFNKIGQFFKQRPSVFTEPTDYSKGISTALTREAGDLINKIMQEHRMYYDAASTDRIRHDWAYSTSTPYSNIKDDLKKIIARSRASVENNGMSNHIDNVFITNVVDTGIKPEAVVKDENGELLEEANKILNEGWKRYNDQWDRSGKSTYYECQALGLKTIINSGSVIRNTVKSRKGDYLPIGNQMVEPDRLDWNRDTFTITQNDASPRAQTQFGIDLDEYGVPLRFYLSGINRAISAENMDIRFKRNRAEQYIGVPWKAPVLKYLWDLANLIEDRCVASRIQAMISLWMNKRDLPMLASKLNSDSQAQWEPGRIMYSEHEPKIIEPSARVTEVFDPLTRLIQRWIAIGTGLSYQILTKDLQGMNFASSRANILEDRRLFKKCGAWFCKEFCQRDWDIYVYWMFLSGKMTPFTTADYKADPWKWQQVYWQHPGWDWVDPAKDSKAAIDLNNNNMLTLKEHYGSKGKNYTEELRQIAIEKKRIKELEEEYEIEMGTKPPGQNMEENVPEEMEENE